MQKPVEKDIVVDGLLLHYYQIQAVGEKKNTIVFLHGWGSNSTLWFSSTLALAEEGYELIFIDLPGFGKSQFPNRAFYLDDFAKLVSFFLQKIGIIKSILVGHSFGGKVAVRISSKRMTMLSGLILVDSSGLLHTNFIAQIKIYIAKKVGPLFQLPFLKGLKSGILRLTGSDDYTAFPELRETFIHIIQEHIYDDLIHIGTPTLVIWGDRDTNSYTPTKDAFIFLRAIPGAQLTLLKNADHYSFLDQPKEFTTAVSLFFKTIHATH